MPLDVRRVMLVAVQAALEDGSRQSTSDAGGAAERVRSAAGRGRRSPARTMLVGAGLFTAGRLALKGGRGRGVLGSLQTRLEELALPDESAGAEEDAPEMELEDDELKPEDDEREREDEDDGEADQEGEPQSGRTRHTARSRASRSRAATRSRR